MMKSLERLTVFAKDQCLGHGTLIQRDNDMHERKKEWKNGEREGIMQHREK